MSIVTVKLTRTLQARLSSQMPLFNSLVRLSKKNIRVSSSLLSHTLDGNISIRLLTMILDRVDNAYPNVQSFDHKGLIRQFSVLKQEGISFGGMFDRSFLISRGKPSINDLFKVVDQDGQKIIALMDDLQVEDFEFEEDTLPPGPFPSQALVPVGEKTARQEQGQRFRAEQAGSRALTRVGLPGTAANDALSGAPSAVQSAVQQALISLRFSNDPNKIIEGVMALMAIYPRQEALEGVDGEKRDNLEKDVDGIQKLLLELFIKHTKAEIRVQVITAFISFEFNEEFTDGLLLYCDPNADKQTSGLAKLFVVATKEAPNSFLTRFVLELLNAEAKKSKDQEIVQAVLQYLSFLSEQLLDNFEMKNIMKLAEECFLSDPVNNKDGLEALFIALVKARPEAVLSGMEKVLDEGAGRSDFHALIKQMLMQNYTDADKKNRLARRICGDLGYDGLPGQIRRDLENIVLLAGITVLPVLMETYGQTKDSQKPRHLKLIDTLAVQAQRSEGILVMVGDFMKKAGQENKDMLTKLLAMKVLYLPSFLRSTRTEIIMLAIDVLFEVREVKGLIEAVLEIGAGFIGRLSNKAEKKDDPQRQRFYLNLAIRSLLQVDPKSKKNSEVLSSIAERLLRTAIVLFKSEPKAIKEIEMLLSSFAIKDAILSSLFNKILPPDNLDQRRMLVGAARNPNLSQANLNSIQLALKKLTNDSIEKKIAKNQDERSQEIEVVELLDGRGFRVASGFEDAWEIFKDVVDVYIALILNPACLTTKNVFVQLLISFYEAFSAQRKADGVEMIKKALAELADKKALYDTGFGNRAMQILGRK